MKKDKKISIYDMAVTALFAAMLCVVGPLAVPVGPVPISLMNLVLFLVLYILGWKSSVLAYVVYLAIGLVGVPVFSGFEGGIGKLLGATGGFLVGFIPAVLVAGLVMAKGKGRKVVAGIGMVAGMAIAYGCGMAWFCITTGNTMGQAFLLCVLPFVLGDIVKIIVAVSFGDRLRKKIFEKNK